MLRRVPGGPGVDLTVPPARSGSEPPAQALDPSAHGDAAPWALRSYALLADGERGALIDPHGRVVWMCAPRWHDDAVFSELIGGRGSFTVCPEDSWNVWGGYYEDGSLIRVSRWTLVDSVVECREALALPAETGRAVLLRRIRALRGDACVRVRLDARAGFGRHPMTAPHREGGEWSATSGPLRLRLSGAEHAVVAGDGTLEARIVVPRGRSHDLVLEVAADAPGHEPLDAARLWERTERSWAKVVPECSALAAPRDSRHAYAVMYGLTSRSGGMVAAATTSLPERANTGRDYDYRYAWIRDQCYAGTAVAAHGPHTLLDDAVRFVTERVLEDGPHLRPAYTSGGGQVLGERTLPLPGYPGGTDRIGNRAREQFQLDTFGEALQLFAAAAGLDRLDDEARRALDVVVRAVEERWREPDAGLWELDPAWWAHSRLSAVVGLRAVARALPNGPADHWTGLARAVLDETERRCLRPSGRWQRSPDDQGVDAALLRALTRGDWPGRDRQLAATRAAVERELAEDGYVYRFRRPGAELGDDEGAFLLCGFMMALACRAEGRSVEAMRWFERTRSACGPPGLFAEEYDVAQRQLRGNLPQAFVHALLLESSVRLAGP